MIEIKEKLLKTVKSPNLLLIGVLVGILLILLSTLGNGEKKETLPPEQTVFSIENYQAELEEDIKGLVKEISGSKRVSVVVTLENTASYSYADTREEATTDKRGENTAETDTELKKRMATRKLCLLPLQCPK